MLNVFQKLFSKLSVENIKIELMRTAYGTEETVLSKLDPRMLIVWSLFFTTVPWFIHNMTILIGLAVLMGVLAYMARVSPLLIVLLIIGVISQFTYLIFVALFLGGTFTALLAVIPLTIKIMIISLSSMAVFTSMDPEKFSDALLSFGVPGKFSFGVSYGYRMLPILIEEYQSIIQSFRLRGKMPTKKGILYWRYIVYFLKISVLAFYPMMLNTAKRTRTTVEALEIRGFSYSEENDLAKKLKLKALKMNKYDYQFVAITSVITICIINIGLFYPL
ncbi:energy-coupling factor transporter transmembrane component T family protein [Peribacillus sp. NPDC096379]|uniref:energy-coupling factor transporter transmembrane component T family protein n=1 Tax=Peribacillus sp. NPDC096379 TaxID=3364393 RepID=UPI0037F5502B